MDLKEAREQIKDHTKKKCLCGDYDLSVRCFCAKGFLEATKAAEPLLEVIEEQREALEKIKKWMTEFSVGDFVEWRMLPRSVIENIAQEALSSSAQFVETYRKEVLGEIL